MDRVVWILVEYGTFGPPFTVDAVLEFRPVGWSEKKKLMKKKKRQQQQNVVRGVGGGGEEGGLRRGRRK